MYAKLQNNMMTSNPTFNHFRVFDVICNGITLYLLFKYSLST